MSIGNSIDIIQGDANRTFMTWRLDTDPFPGKCAFNAFDAALTTAYMDYLVSNDPDNPVVPPEFVDISTCFWTLSWGVGVAGQPCGTADQTAEVDFIRGLWISVPATSLSIAASYPALPFPARQPKIRVTGMVGKGSKAPAGMTGVPRRTIDVGVVQGPSLGFPIPKFAVSAVLLASSPIVPGDVTLQQFTDSTEQQLLSQNNSIGDTVESQVPIANGALDFNVVNNTAFSLRLRVVFYLAL